MWKGVKSMTLEEFFGVVGTLGERWRVRRDGEIRTADAPHRSLLGVVCAHRTGQEYRPDEWQRAAETLGLTFRDAETLHRASELTLPYDRDVRLYILDITGLRLRRIVKTGPPRQVLSKPAPVGRGARPHGNSQRNATGFDDQRRHPPGHPRWIFYPVWPFPPVYFD